VVHRRQSPHDRGFVTGLGNVLRRQLVGLATRARLRAGLVLAFVVGRERSLVVRDLRALDATLAAGSGGRSLLLRGGEGGVLAVCSRCVGLA